MKTMTIDNLKEQLLLASLSELDHCRMREDFYGLHQDIRAELNRNAPDKADLIYTYAGLFKKHLNMLSPESAFEAGALLACYPQGSDIDPTRAMMRYYRRISIMPEHIDTQNEISRLYREIHSLLGDSHALLDEYNDLFRKCNGILANHAYAFFRLGYDWAAQIESGGGASET